MEIISLILTIAVAFVIAVIITKFEIPILRQKAGQNIREEGLESHYAKAGTPSMGGISFIIAACILVNSLPGDFTGNAQLFSKEIENSDCNPETLIITGFTPEELSALLCS